jgi:hypothetical protein
MSAAIPTGSPAIPAELLPYLTGQLHDYSSLQDSIYKINITFAILVIITLGMRIYVRYFMIRAAGFDDGK